MQQVGSKTSILVVEDEASNREIVRRTLESEGYEVLTASNGREGLEEFDRANPSLVILDVKMPLMDGWDTLKRLRLISDRPVIMLTVFGETQDKVQGIERGADDYIVKPFELEELVARVKSVLRRSGFPDRTL